MTTDTQDTHMLDQTRRMAADALERANDRMRNLRSTVQDYASTGMQNVREGATAAQRQIGQYAQTGTRYVSENPMRSALIAAAIGAAVAGLVIAYRHQNRRDGF